MGDPCAMDYLYLSTPTISRCSSSGVAVKTPVPQCSVHRCKRKPALECGMCKGCCEGRGLGCSSHKHRNGPPQTKKVSSFTLQRPPAALPSLHVTVPTIPSSSATTTSASNIDPPAVAPQMAHLFRDKLPEQSLAEWRDREQAVEDLQVAASLRRQNELSMAKQVVIHLWDQVCIFPYSMSFYLLIVASSNRMEMTLRLSANKTSPPTPHLTLHSAQASWPRWLSTLVLLSRSGTRG